MVEFQASAPSWLGRQERCLWAEKLSSNQPEKSCFLCLGLWVALPLECWPQLPVPSEVHLSLSPALTSLAPTRHVS